MSLLILPPLEDRPVLLPVDDEGGEVGGYQSVDPGRGPTEETVMGGNGASYGAQQHPGHVETEQSQLAQPASLGELQGDADNQLHRHVEHDVLRPSVDKLVGEEPPDLLPLARVVDQVGTAGGGNVIILSQEAGYVNIVPDVETNLILGFYLLFSKYLRV